MITKVKQVGGKRQLSEMKHIHLLRNANVISKNMYFYIAPSNPCLYFINEKSIMIEVIVYYYITHIFGQNHKDIIYY
jgi:hypothetical protein